MKAGFRKDQRSNYQHLLDHRKAREFQKNIYFCFTDYAKAFDCMDHNKMWKILKRDGIARSPYLPPEKPICRSKQELEPDIEQQTGSKLGKEYIKAVYHHSAYLTYMQSTSCKMPGWMKHNLESKLPGEISITSDMQMTPPYGRKQEELKSLVMKVKEESEKAGLKLKIQKTKIMASDPITS